MQPQFEKFCENIKLTTTQREDARVKYTGVCKALHSHFYPDIEYNGDTKLLFGSYANHTAIRPISKDQDVDVLFKIPEEIYQKYATYNSGGQSALLSEVREILIDSRYGLGEKPKAWGKVILVKTVDGTHNVELLPAYEKEDRSFIIPNSESGGSWNIFDPRDRLEKFRESNKQTNGLTGDLSRMVKRWVREAPSISIKSFEVENFVILFLQSYNYSEKSYSNIVTDFFSYLVSVVNMENRSYVETAKSRSDKALSFEQEGNLEDATVEWKKIFGDDFPKQTDKFLSEDQVYVKAPDEKFIEELLPVSIDGNVKVDIETYCKPQNGSFRKSVLLSKLPIGWIFRKDSLEFKAITYSYNGNYDTKWKVRNFGEEAERANKLRGEILEDNNGLHRYKDGAAFYGEHFLECYLIKDGTCIAKKRITVPIGK